MKVAALLETLSCCDLSDSMDRLGIAGQCLGIRPLNPTFRLVGQAFTLRYGIGRVGGTVGDYIDEVGPNQVVAIDNSGRLDATVWGDILTFVAKKRGIAGTVIDGVCRDIDRSVALGYPIFARGNYMRTGKDRVQLEESGGVIGIGGVAVAHGDWLRGDGDGVVAIPHERIDEVIAVAQEIVAKEERIRKAVGGSSSLRQARADIGYHSLQTRQATSPEQA